MSKYSVDHLRERQEKENGKQDFATIDLLGDSVAVFLVFNSKDIPDRISQQLQSDIDQTISKMRFFDKLLSSDQLEDLFQGDRRVVHSKDIYLDSLLKVAVSDKDISNPLGKYLGVDDLLVFQVDRWPCRDCDTDTGMRMKLRIVDADTGYIIWTGTNEKSALLDGEFDDLDGVARKLANDLWDSFHHRFRQKWHRKRFNNLALLANK
ncbi:MAG: hypothetical protein GY866_04310 [Proteobacteria bacterium]|nr:hypothetical protein [Pseudomonadota bacterium]